MSEHKTEDKSSDIPEVTGSNKKNLFKPGESGNPAGRPKGTVSIVDAIRRKLEEEFPDSTNDEKKTYLDMITEAIIKKGLAGDVSMLKDMIDRTDGKSRERIDVTSKGERIEGINYIKPDGNNKSSTNSETA